MLSRFKPYKKLTEVSPSEDDQREGEGGAVAGAAAGALAGAAVVAGAVAGKAVAGKAVAGVAVAGAAAGAVAGAVAGGSRTNAEKTRVPSDQGSPSQSTFPPAKEQRGEVTKKDSDGKETDISPTEKKYFNLLKLAKEEKSKKPERSSGEDTQFSSNVSESQEKSRDVKDEIQKPLPSTSTPREPKRQRDEERSYFVQKEVEGDGREPTTSIYSKETPYEFITNIIKKTNIFVKPEEKDPAGTIIRSQIARYNLRTLFGLRKKDPKLHLSTDDSSSEHSPSEGIISPVQGAQSSLKENETVSKVAPADATIAAEDDRMLHTEDVKMAAPGDGTVEAAPRDAVTPPGDVAEALGDIVVAETASGDRGSEGAKTTSEDATE